jgi:2-succinyl-5-enolpyruvyl-6-hydroxy-3-cyclohexene-1-carboxylate synthase
LAEPTSGAIGSPNNINAYRYLLPWFRDVIAPEAQKPSTDGKAPFNCKPAAAADELPPSQNHRAHFTPHQAVVFGRPTLNRSVIEFLADPQVAVTVVAPGEPPWPDAWRNTARFGSEISPEWANAKQNLAPGGSHSEFLEQWLAASDITTQVITEHLERAEGELDPLAVANQVFHASNRTGGWLIVGASNPIRDLDLVAWREATKGGVVSTGATANAAAALPPTQSCVAKPPKLTVISNRGVAGIDGTIATALGIATATASGMQTAAGGKTVLGSQTPLNRQTTPGINRLYLGDLTFLHDVASLLNGYFEQRPQLQIIVANDGGGSIFTGLEHGQWAEAEPNLPESNFNFRRHALKRVFTTPQSASIEKLCAGFEVAYTKVERLSELQAALAQPKCQVEVVEVKLNVQNRGLLHRQLATQITDALRERAH